MNPLIKARLYYETLRFLRPTQLLGHGVHLGRYALFRRVPGLVRAALRATDFLVVDAVRRPPDFVLQVLAPHLEADCIADGRFSFLNVERGIDRVFGRNLADAPKLFRYNFHYLDWAVALAKADRIPDLERLVIRWLKTYPFDGGEAWEPYPISLRLVNLVYCRALTPEHRTNLVAALDRATALHAVLLPLTLEYQLQGNHLFKNAKAMLFAGAVVNGKLGMLLIKCGQAIIEQQMREQILADGGHFERSPMYHEIVLQDLIECLWLIRDRGLDADEEQWSRTLLGMSGFLAGIVHPDGEIPLFGDSAFDVAPRPKHLLTFAERVLGRAALEPGCEERRGAFVLRRYEDSGYYVISEVGQGGHLVFDCGPIGPDHLPGHAHCDMLSFEWSCQGRRIVSDTGVATYEPGPERDYCRNTAAHNCPAIQGHEQAEMWAAFRVARRTGIEFRVAEWTGDGVTVKAQQTPAAVGLDGFVERIIHCCQKGELEIMDRLEGGKATTRLQLHPGCAEPERMDGNKRALVASHTGLPVHIVSSGILDVERSKIYQRFNEPSACWAVVAAPWCQGHRFSFRVEGAG